MFMVLLPPVISGPWNLIEDFNLVRFAEDKNNANFSQASAASFNKTIHSWMSPRNRHSSVTENSSEIEKREEKEERREVDCMF